MSLYVFDKLTLFYVYICTDENLVLGRMWPVNVGLGFGLGRSYADCDRQFNPNSIPGWHLGKPSSPPS